MDSIAGPFEIDWSREDLERVTHTVLKKYNAEIHSQSSIEGAIELKRQYGLTGREVAEVVLEVFDVAYNIIGGGEEGNKHVVRNKEEADHSLPYLIAVALLDGEVMPAQFAPERIRRGDVQALLSVVHIVPSEEMSRRFPQELPCRLTVKLKDGRVLSIEKRDYEGFTSLPMSWETVVRKFNRLSESHTTGLLRERIVDTVENLEKNEVRQLTGLISQATPDPIAREGVLQYGS
jgi:2-methylcitrate dehydratase